MPYPNAKVYSDGSHYIAIPQQPKKMRKKVRTKKNTGSSVLEKQVNEVLEKMVIDSVIEELSNSKTINFIVNKLLELQENQTKANIVLNLLLKEKQTTDTAISNIMAAIEQGGSTNTAMKRMRELEQRQENLEKEIAREKSKTPVLLTEKDIRDYYVQALRLEPKLLINLMIKEIVLYEDKIEIYFTSPLKTSPDNNRGFSFATKYKNLTIKVPFRKNKLKLDYTIEMYIR